MEQIYFDEIHKKGIDGKTVFLKTLLIGVCVVLCPLVFVLAGSLGLLFVAGVIYGTYFLFQRMNQEFEYIYTNGEVDIDVIYGKTSRKRLITLKANQMELMAKYTDGYEAYSKDPKVSARVNVSNGNKEETYYVVLTCNQQKKLVLFSPSQKLVDALKPYLRERFRQG